MKAACRIAVVGSIAASAGCFYVEPINQRPALDILPLTSDSVFRGGMVTLEAVASDPEKHVVAFQWRVYACTDATSIEGCDRDPVFTGVEREATFRVPPFRADPDGEGPGRGAPVESLRVILEGRDDHGAEAKPDQVLIVPVDNARPTLKLRMVAEAGAVVGTPIEVFARYGDPDDSAQNVTLTWTLYSPSQLPGTLIDVAAMADEDPTLLQQGKGFTPQVTGNWDVMVVATDRLDVTTDDHLTITVVPDAPPCLDLWDPIASPVPAPITEPTLFQVARVRDDLDAFPRTSSKTYIGETEFHWSIKVGAGSRQPLTNPLNSLVIDPQTYAPGTHVEVRVEIFDRNDTAITCADAAATCSVISQPSCIQRQTWLVEAR